MFNEKIERFMEYCKSREYHVKMIQANESLHRLYISNKYLQRMELKVINGSKVRILSHENTRFAQEIQNTIKNLLIEVIPFHYDHIIKPVIPEGHEKIDREEKCRIELEEIISTLEKLNPNDEVKIYTSFKGAIAIFRDSAKISLKYADSPYERIYQLIKEKKLIIHFEWIRKTPPRKKPKRGKKAPAVSKKLLIR